MLTPYMMTDRITIGDDTLVYLLTVDKLYFNSTLFELRPPLSSSIAQFASVNSPIHTPFHVFTNPRECVAFVRALNEIGEKHFGGRLSEAYIKYERTLHEHGIDILSELRHTVGLSSDQDVFDYLDRLNARLRQHFENFPRYHDNPVRLPGQKGSLRKSKNIDPINVRWP